MRGGASLLPCWVTAPRCSGFGMRAYAAIVAELRQQLMHELISTGDPRLVNGGKFFETPPMAGPVGGDRKK